MSPYVEMFNGEKLADEPGDFMYFVDDFHKVDRKQKHSQTITEFIRKYHIPEEQLPILFAWNKKNDEHSVVPLKEDTHIYSLIESESAKGRGIPLKMRRRLYGTEKFMKKCWQKKVGSG